MKNHILLLAMLAISTGVLAEPDGQLRRDLQLKVADAYSQCGAYYEIAASVLNASNNVGVDQARAMKEESMAMAVVLATGVEGEAKGSQRADAGFAKAIEDMHALIKSDPDAFRDWADQQRKSCRMAVNDPPTFVDRTLAEFSGKHRRYITVPKDLTVEKILKEGKPMTSVPDITKCAAPGKDVTISLDNVLVDGGMICAEHRGGECSGERHWMSYRQFIESLDPNHEFNGYSQTLSISFKNGQPQDKRTLVACLVLPETRT